MKKTIKDGEVRVVGSRLDLTPIASPRLGMLFRLETDTAVGVEVYRDEIGLHVVDDAGDVHGPLEDGSPWRDLVAQMLDLSPMPEGLR